MISTPTIRRLALTALSAALASAGVGCKKEQPKPTDPLAVAFDDFAKRIDDYAKLRKQVVDSIGDLDPTKSQAEITARATALANALVARRPQAKAGDIFTPEVATVLATLIKQEYSRRPEPVQETRDDQQEEVPDFVPEVNQRYPTTYPLATFPPTLLPLLPPLPEHVEYRVVQRYLVLRDVEANIIIDVMPNAVPT